MSSRLPRASHFACRSCGAPTYWVGRCVSCSRYVCGSCMGNNDALAGSLVSCRECVAIVARLNDELGRRR